MDKCVWIVVCSVTVKADNSRNLMAPDKFENLGLAFETDEKKPITANASGEQSSTSMKETKQP